MTHRYDSLLIACEQAQTFFGSSTFVGILFCLACKCASLACLGGQGEFAIEGTKVQVKF